MIEMDMQNLRRVRGEELYKYATGNHMRIQSKIFADYCKEKFGKEPV
jgi:hypothetical protein